MAVIPSVTSTLAGIQSILGTFALSGTTATSDGSGATSLLAAAASYGNALAVAPGSAVNLSS